MTVSNKLAAQLNDGLVGIDPTIIILILSALVQLFVNCNKTADEAFDMIPKLKAFQWLKFKRKLRAVMFDGGYDTADVDAVYGSFRKHYKSLTREDMVGLYTEHPVAMPV